MLLLIAVHVIVVIIITTTIITTTTTTCSVVILLLNSDALTAGSCKKSHATPGGGGGGGGGGGVMGMLNLKRRDCKGADSTAGVLGGVLDTVPGPSAGSSCPQATSPPRCSSWTPATNVTAVHDSRVWGLGFGVESAGNDAGIAGPHFVRLLLGDVGVLVVTSAARASGKTETTSQWLQTLNPNRPPYPFTC